MAYGYDENDPKQPPGYIDPVKAKGLLEQFLGNIGQGGFNQAIGTAQDVVGQPGGASGIMPFLGKLGSFVGNGGKAADAYIQQGLQSTRKGALEGMNMLRGQQGAAGGLGSTIAGLSDASLLSEALGQANQVRATGEQMRETNKMNRLGLGMQGLGSLGNLMQQEKTGNLLATQNIASLIGQQDNAAQQQLFSGMGAMGQMEQGPQQHAMDIWQTIMGKPKQPSFGDLLLGLGGAFASGGYF